MGRSLLIEPKKNKWLLKNAQVKLSENTRCDNKVLVNAVEGFVAARAEGKEKEFCVEYLLNNKALTKIVQSSEELKQRVGLLGYDSTAGNRNRNKGGAF